MNVIGIILAAGFGTRLRPSTDRCPKPLIPVGGIEPLFFAMNQCYTLGIRKIVVNAHYLSDKVEQSVARWAQLFPGLECRISFEKPEILGTGGGVIKIVQEHQDWFKGAGLLLQNGDTLAQFDFSALLSKPSESTFAISFLPDHLKKYNPLWIHHDGSWAGIGKDAPGPNLLAAHFLGVHYISPKACGLLATPSFKVEVSDLFNAIYRPLVNSGLKIESRICMSNSMANDRNFWFDMTTPAFLLEAQHHVLDTFKKSPFWPELLRKRYPGIREVEPGVWVASNFNAASRKFVSPVVLVDSESTLSEVDLGSLVLGPHASFIYETGALRTGRNTTLLNISNSVVFVSASNDEKKIPFTVRDEVCVV